MKRYRVFYGDAYYPKGGWLDNQKEFQTLEHAVGFMEGVTTTVLTWAHIVDMEIGEIVKEVARK